MAFYNADQVLDVLCAAIDDTVVAVEEAESGDGAIEVLDVVVGVAAVLAGREGA